MNVSLLTRCYQALCKVDSRSPQWIRKQWDSCDLIGSHSAWIGSFLERCHMGGHETLPSEVIHLMSGYINMPGRLALAGMVQTPTMRLQVLFNPT